MAEALAWQRVEGLPDASRVVAKEVSQAMVEAMIVPLMFAHFRAIVPAADRPACWWALLVGAPPTSLLS